MGAREEEEEERERACITSHHITYVSTVLRTPYAAGKLVVLLVHHALGRMHFCFRGDQSSFISREQPTWEVSDCFSCFHSVCVRGG